MLCPARGVRHWPFVFGRWERQHAEQLRHPQTRLAKLHDRGIQPLLTSGTEHHHAVLLNSSSESIDQIGQTARLIQDQQLVSREHVHGGQRDPESTACFTEPFGRFRECITAHEDTIHRKYDNGFDPSRSAPS